MRHRTIQATFVSRATLVTLRFATRQRSMRIHFRSILLITIIVAGCSNGDDNSNQRKKLTERERDSVLSQSGLPGARVVGRALTAADSETSHTMQLDSASQ